MPILFYSIYEATKKLTDVGKNDNVGTGEVLLDGHDIKTLNLRWLRQQIGLVSQEPALFATTIRENLLLGRADGTATQAELEEAARVANAHSFIVKLPDGFDTQVTNFRPTQKNEKGVILI